MEIVLINPFFDFMELYMVNRVFPPLSLGYMASIARKEGFAVRIVDANAQRIKSTDSYWNNLKADVFVITTASLDRWQCPVTDLIDVKNIIGKVRKANKEARIIVTGPHGTADPEGILKQFGDVVVIRGEPERVVMAYLKKIEGGKGIDRVEGISYVKEGKVKNNPEKTESVFQDLPPPAYDLLPMGKYRYEIMGKKFSLVEYTRGCPYNCIFCSKIMYGDKYRVRDLEVFVQELRILQKMGVKNLWFIDLEFCIRKKAVRKLCERMIKEGFKFNWAIQTRVDTVEDELLKLMKRAGCSLIHFGVESGYPEVLKHTGKGVTLPQLKKGFYLARKHGIKTLGYFIIGNYKENEKQVIKTIEFAKKMNPDYVSFVIMELYMGAPLLRQIGCNLPMMIYDKEIPLNRLRSLQRKANVDFYFRPKYILGRLLGIRGFNDIWILYNGFMNFLVPLVFGEKKSKYS